MIDEADAFKNLACSSKMQRIAGLPKSDSFRAFDMYLKIRYIQQSPHTAASCSPPELPSATRSPTYDATNGKPALRISTLDWPNGWPHASLSTSGAPSPQ